MGDYLKDILNSGKKILSDTKTPKLVKESKKNVPEALGDPHKVFIRRCIQERPKKAEVVAELKRFIEAAEQII